MSDSPAPASPARTAPRPETLTLDSLVIGKAADPYLSVRTANALANAGKRTVGAVLAMSEGELARVRDLGPVGRAQVDRLRTAIDGPLCPITATIDTTTRRCGNARGHSDDCRFLSDPDAACDACDDTERMDGIEWCGCMTGDCPHQTQAECDAAILALVREVLGERAASRAVPLASGSDGAEPLKASGLTEREELECNMLDFAEPSDHPASDAPAPPREDDNAFETCVCGAEVRRWALGMHRVLCDSYRAASPAQEATPPRTVGFTHCYACGRNTHWTDRMPERCRCGVPLNNPHSAVKCGECGQVGHDWTAHQPAAPTPEAPCVLCGFTASASRFGANPNGCCGACGLPIPPAREASSAPGLYDSGTYGEMPAEIRALIPGHEWDNMTRDDQRGWLKGVLWQSLRTVAALTADRAEPALSLEDADALSAMVDYAATRGYEDGTLSAATAARACDVRNRLLTAARAREG